VHRNSPPFNPRVLLSLMLCAAVTMGSKDLANTHHKVNSKGGRSCRVSGRHGGMGLIRKYGINMKRQQFREKATQMGWTKYN